jgi:hypothetical protein
MKDCIEIATSAQGALDARANQNTHLVIGMTLM